jgi:hypothetical protein
MATKYIVNNVSGQTITGDLTINGNVIVTGTSKNNSVGIYNALFTQTGPLTGTSLTNFYDKLIIGETYTIANYVDDADFSNVADVQSGVINQTGCVFIATGSTPNSWADGTELTSFGNLVVDVLENALGYDLSWVQFGAGVYGGANENTGPLINSFPRETVQVIADINPFNGLGNGRLLAVYGGSGTLGEIDDTLFIATWDWDNDSPADNSMYYVPIQITIKQDLDVTPVVIDGSNEEFPFGNVRVRLYCGGDMVESFTCDDTVTVNDYSELIDLLNTDIITSFLGTFSQGGPEGMTLTMSTNLKNQFCPTDTLTFEVDAD